ncbi:hypothetical protein BSY16_4496 (plasmid) [Sinorhizobium sp. RAC02]|nr:hypothetical protein BSY16_4496 [Sinorhizobium sp. RAC02]
MNDLLVVQVFVRIPLPENSTYERFLGIRAPWLLLEARSGGGRMSYQRLAEKSFCGFGPTG